MTAPGAPLVLIGAGGLAREVLAVLDAGDAPPPCAILDDDPNRWGERLHGIPIAGGLDRIDDFPDALVLLCPGPGRVRLELAARLARRGLAPDRFATVVHPGIRIPRSCSVGAGGILLAGVVLTADVQLGAHVVVMPNAVLTHDDQLADGVTVCAGVLLGGGVRVGPAAYLGAGAVIRQDLSIGAGALIGQGSVVLSDVPAEEVWVGNPARYLRPAPALLAGSRHDSLPIGETHG
jgi:sugar O-acyltransferase (sialic acid O-acetyltransferase NeuD family)